MAQVPIDQPTPSVPDNRSIIPLATPDPGLKIDLTDIQGDIYPTFPKKAEKFIFFSIPTGDPEPFRQKLGEFRQYLTSSAQVIKHLEEIEEARKKNKGIPKPLPKERMVKLSQYQIGFSLSGMNTFKVDRIGDQDFDFGAQRRQAHDLGDEPVSGTTFSNFVGQHWTPDWREKKIDGVILIAAECEETLEEAVEKALNIFGSSINVEIVEHGCVRPGEEEGHEHFGFLDGISQPALNGLVQPHAGQLPCEPGVIIMGIRGDSALNSRPPWAVGGSIMAFRKLHQRVPEFNKFLEDHPIERPGLSREKGAELRGAKMVGRWKSGVPIDLSDDKDDHAFLDPELINNFRYHTPTSGQARCPFSAHIRKTAPRQHIDSQIAGVAKISGALPRALMMRAGIPYGREVTPDECTAQKTLEDRGLLFVSYQSVLGFFGFNFIQKLWANTPNFPPQEDGVAENPNAGFDPIIGNMTGPVRTRFATGTDNASLTDKLTMNDDFIVAEGGEYFFIPPLSTVDKISGGVPLDSPAPATGGGTLTRRGGPLDPNSGPGPAVPAA